MIISLIEHGKETVLKEVSNYYTIQMYNESNITDVAKMKISMDYFDQDNIYLEYDFNTGKLREFSGSDWEQESVNNIENQNSQIINKEAIKKYLDRINEKTNLNISIDNMEKVNGVFPYNSQVYKDDKNQVTINMNYISKKKDIIDFKIYYRAIEDNVDKELKGVLSEDYIYISPYENYKEILGFYNNSNEKLLIFDQVDNSFTTFDAITVENGKMSSKGVVKREAGEGVYNATNINDYIYISKNNSLDKYKLENGEYKKVKSYELAQNSQYYNINSSNSWYIQKLNDKAYLSKIENDELSPKYDVTTQLSSIPYANRIYSYDDSVIFIKYNGFIMLQKNKNSIPSVPEEPSNPQEPSKPENPTIPTNPGDNGGTKPSEDKVVTEVPKINPNEKNEIPVKTTERTKNIEVVVKDIEAIKNGNGSLNITTDNGVEINLPLSTIDKSLLEGAKDVTIKLDIIENSDIVKNIKGVNKVFDFNLIINKEDGTTNIHNFKEGLVEIKLNLTDKDFEGFNRDKIVVYYYNDSTKAFEEMETSVNGNEVTFKTSHFSKYVIAEKIETDNEEIPANEGANGSKPSTDNKTGAGKGQLPETGARVSNTTILVLAVGMLAIGGAMFFRKRKHA
ncbi:LPXTG cell wall anchor domain-containing protein [Clostridium sp. AL.422]|uniref:LPXTG cell wall anchor domain-containing protein n=1 Tax=Clostridium TaxID=1485 RepID=UPI00293DFEC5|nr:MULTISPECIES: LPXTG cell wall anchor domain-containing protein [unclassified Clostridium]MDV4150323.1 LPXTG cell wall anchor domain-containing protein [Clostridium sp. AL.422]